MCARKKLEIESYERQESATVQAKKAVNLNAFFFLFFFLSRTIQDSGLVRTRSLQMLIFHEIPEIPLFEFPRRTQGKKKQKQKLQCLLVIGLGLARWHLRVIRLQSSYIFIYVLYKANRVTNK